MIVMLYLIPLALFFGAAGLFVFIWGLKTGQFDDPEGDARRILLDDDQNLPKI
jgi:cbb3-type cytochrome oxidase maturation protein